MADEATVEGSEFSAVIAAEIRAARTYDRSELSSRRALAIQYARGEMPDVPARKGGFSQSSRVFSDTVSWLLPQIVRVFMASDQMVQYDKVKAENDDWAQDASEYTNYSFRVENDGYRILHNATSDSLELGNGLVSSYYEPPRIETKWFRNRTEAEIALLLTEEDWKPSGIVKQGKPRKVMAEDPVTGDQVEVEEPTLSVKLARQERVGRICDTVCKPENLLLNPTATTIETARFAAYLHDDKTRSDLMEMADDYGWDKAKIEELASGSRQTTEDEVTVARDGDRWVSTDSPIKSGDPIDLYECYIRADRDGDGVAELNQVWWAGTSDNGVLLGEEEWEGDNPYTDIPCYPVPHRFDAQSVFDRTHDIAQVNTILLRGLLDNTAAATFPMREVDEGSVKNPDILVNPKFGGLIWKTKGSNPIINYAPQYTGDKTLLAIQYMDEMVSKRTGVSRSTMALDPEALQNQTATAAQQQRDASVSQVELIARNQAEMGWAKFFGKRLRLAVRHGIVREIPSSRGEPIMGDDGQPTGETSGFRTIDASQWDPSMAVTINVGLGTGSRDRDLAMLTQIQGAQRGMAQELAAAGLKDKALEFIPKIRTTAVRITESAGLRNPEEYWPEFTDQDLQAAKQLPPPENPEAVKAQIDAQAKDAQAQRDHEYRMAQVSAKQEMDALAANNKLALDKYQTDQELALKQWQITQEMALNERLGIHKQNLAASVQVGGEPG